MTWMLFFSQVFWARRQRLQTCSSHRFQHVPTCIFALPGGDPWSSEVATHWARPKESKAQNPNFEPETPRDSTDQVVEVWWNLQKIKNNTNDIHMRIWMNGELYVQLLQGWCSSRHFWETGENVDECRWHTKIAKKRFFSPPATTPSHAPCHHVVCPTTLFLPPTRSSALPGSGSAHHGNFFSSKHHQISFRLDAVNCCFLEKNTRMICQVHNPVLGETRSNLASLQVPSLSVGARIIFVIILMRWYHMGHLIIHLKSNENRIENTFQAGIERQHAELASSMVSTALGTMRSSQFQ